MNYDDNEEKIETFKDIKQEYDDWLEFYESTHDDVFWRPQWDREVYAYACLNEDQRKRFYN